MNRPSADEAMELLAKRRGFLASLRESPKQKPGLADDCGVARSTVDRAIRELQMAGLVHRGDDGYELTVCGEMVYSRFSSFRESLDALYQNEDVLSLLPNADLVDPEVLVGAEVIRSDIHAPDKAMHETVRLIENAVHVRGISPAVHGAYVEAFGKHITEDDMETELVFSTEALLELATTYADQIQTPTHELLTVYEIDALPPLGMMLVEYADGTLEGSFGVYADTGVQAVVRNTSENAVRWAEQIFEYYRDRATRVDL
jgi:predicted transcriptional regulator